MKTADAKKVLLAFLVVVLSSANVNGQERVEGKELVKYAIGLNLAASAEKDIPFKAMNDIMKSSAVHKDEQIAFLIPATGINESLLEKVNDKSVTPLGQLWLRDLVLQNEGKNVDTAKLRTVTIDTGKEKIVVDLCFIGLQKNAEGKTELVVYGKGKEIIAHPILEAHEEEQTTPMIVDLEAPTDKPMIVSILLFGKHRAQFEVTGSKK